jgi:hypothetical protein
MNLGYGVTAGRIVAVQRFQVQRFRVDVKSEL